MSYQNDLTEIINKRLTDEISSASMYSEASNYISSTEISKEILEHAQEEFDHFNILMDFATSHNLKVAYDFDRSVVKKVTRNNKQLLSEIQKLESKAIKDYKEAAIFAKNNDDIEGYEMFAYLMQEEIKHFDEIARSTGDTRKLRENFAKTKNFKEYLKGQI